MPAVSNKQRIATAIAEHTPGKLYAKNAGMLKMSHEQLHDFASGPVQPKKSKIGNALANLKKPKDDLER